MSFGPANTVPFALEINKDFPDPEEEDFIPKFVDSYRDIARASNSKDVGRYLLQEIPNGQNYFDPANQQNLLGVFRKVIQIPALVAGVNPPIAHGITSPAVTLAYTFTRIYGVIESPGPAILFAPIPQGGPNDVQVEVNATSILITAAAAYAGFTGNVVLEYIKR